MEVGIKSNFQLRTPKVGAPGIVLGFGQKYCPLAWSDNEPPQSNDWSSPSDWGFWGGVVAFPRQIGVASEGRFSDSQQVGHP